MQDEIFMDIPAVRGFSDKFQNVGEILDGVSTTMEALMTTLKMTAFIGNVGGTAVANFLEQLKPVIDELAEKCREMSRDLADSATAYENEDAATSRYY